LTAKEDKIYKERSVQIVGVEKTGDLINYKIQIDPNLYTYKSKEEIADMIQRTIDDFKETHNRRKELK